MCVHDARAAHQRRNGENSSVSQRNVSTDVLLVGWLLNLMHYNDNAVEESTSHRRYVAIKSFICRCFWERSSLLRVLVLSVSQKKMLERLKNLKQPVKTPPAHPSQDSRLLIVSGLSASKLLEIGESGPVDIRNLQYSR